MTEYTYTAADDEGALVRVPGRFGKQVVICVDRVVEHSNMHQSEYRYRSKEVRFEDIAEVRQDRIYVVLAYSKEPHDREMLRFDKVRPAQAFERVVRAGVEALKGDKKAAKDFEKRIAKLQEQHGTDTTIYVRERRPRTYKPEAHRSNIVQTKTLETPEDGKRLIILLKENPSPPLSRITDKSQTLPPMLEAYWKCGGEDGYIGVGYRLGEPDEEYSRDGWYHISGNPFAPVGLFGYSEKRLREAVAEAVENKRTVYLEDRRTHSNIQYLSGGSSATNVYRG